MLEYNVPDRYRYQIPDTRYQIQRPRYQIQIPDTRYQIPDTTSQIPDIKLTHPKFEIEKTYYVKIKNNIKDNDIARIEDGIMVEGIKTLKAVVEVISRNKDYSEIKLTIREGKKRQIRKMINNIGYYLVELKRIKFGPINLGDLREGNFRYLVKSEIEKLREK